MKLYNRILAEPAPGLPGIPSRGGSPPCPTRPCTTCSPTTPGPPGPGPGPGGQGPGGDPPGGRHRPGPPPPPPAGRPLPGDELPGPQGRGRAVRPRRLHPAGPGGLLRQAGPAACPGPGAPIPGHFDLVDSLDYEVELAVVLGKDATQRHPGDRHGLRLWLHHPQRCVRPEPPDGAQAVVLWQEPGTASPPWGRASSPGRSSPWPPRPGHPGLGQRGAAPGGGDRPADLLHPPHPPGALPGG